MTTKCFYCSQNLGKPDLTYHVHLYAKIGSNLGIGILGLKRTTKYYEKSIKVPRCEFCFNEHKRPGKPAFRWGLLTAIMTAIITWFTAKRLYIVMPVSLIVGFIGSLIYFGTAYRNRIKKLGIKDSNDIRDFPAVRQMLDEGWSTIKP